MLYSILTAFLQPRHTNKLIVNNMSGIGHHNLEMGEAIMPGQ